MRKLLQTSRITPPQRNEFLRGLFIFFLSYVNERPPIGANTPQLLETVRKYKRTFLIFSPPQRVQFLRGFINLLRLPTFVNVDKLLSFNCFFFAFFYCLQNFSVYTWQELRNTKGVIHFCKFSV